MNRYLKKKLIAVTLAVGTKADLKFINKIEWNDK